MKKLYIAYGSNMNIEQMAMRCPKATPLGKYILEDYKLEFRGVANIIECKGARTPVAIWSITESCERSLDRNMCSRKGTKPHISINSRSRIPS